MLRHHQAIAFPAACGLAAALAAFINLSTLARADDAPRADATATDQADAGADATSEPLASPLADESRALLDREEGRQFPRGAASDRVTVQVQGDVLGAEDDPSNGNSGGALPPHLRALRDSLGGSVVDQFPSLQGGASQTSALHSPWWKQFAGSLEAGVMAPPLSGPQPPSPPGHWPNWAPQPPLATFILPASSELQTANPALRPVAALRATAMELDASANRLEELDLYGQADAMRELAQQMRVDARRLAPAAETPEAAMQWSDPDAGRRPHNFGGQAMPTDPPRLRQRSNDPPRPARRPRNAGEGRSARPDAGDADRADQADGPPLNGGGVPFYPVPSR
jgi:hypothetical protein